MLFRSKEANEYAHKAYALGFPLPGLKQLLVTAGKWQEPTRSEEHTSELQSRFDLVCRLLLEKKKKKFFFFFFKKKKKKFFFFFFKQKTAYEIET